MGAMAGLSGLSMGLAFMAAGVGGDDDDGEAYWDKIPAFEKERNLIFMLPPGVNVEGASEVGRDGRYIKLPIQYGLNVFSTLGYQLADLARNNADPVRGVSAGKAALNMVNVTFGAFNPIGGAVDVSDPISVGMAAAPSLADVFIQFGAGVDGFGRPTAPAKSPYDSKPDSENFSPSMAGTWEQRLSRWLNDKTGGDEAESGKIDLSPGTIRNVKRNLTGGTGDFISSVFVNLPSKMLAPEAEIEHRDIPVLKAFYGKVDDNNDLSLAYDRRAEVMKATDIEDRRRKLDIDFDYDEKSLGLQEIGGDAKAFTTNMTRLRKEELAAMADPDTTDAEKKLAARMIKKERAEYAREFNEAYFNMRKEVEGKK